MNRKDAIKAAMEAINESPEDDKEVSRVGYIVGYSEPQGWQIVHPGDEGRKHGMDYFFYVTLEGPQEPQTRKLFDLVDDHHANAYTFADLGSGSGFGESGQLLKYDDEAASLYGNIELTALDYPMRNENGALCFYASDWQDGIDRDVQPHRSPSDYQFRIIF